MPSPIPSNFKRRLFAGPHFLVALALCYHLWHLDASEGAPSTASEADICSAKRHVRFTPNSGLLQCSSEFPLRANSGQLSHLRSMTGLSFSRAVPKLPR